MSPVSVRLAVPVLVRLPWPLMTPAKLELMFVPPVLRVAPLPIATALALVPPVAALPLSEPIVSLSSTFRLAPALMPTAELSPIALPPRRAKVPARTHVVPV